MCKLLCLPLVAVLALGAFNFSTGHSLLHLPGISVGTLTNTVRNTVGDTVRDGVRSAAVNRAEDTVTAAALTSKIKAKMALDDLVNAADVNVDTDGRVVTLTGDVGSKDEQRRALRIATETAGVTKVVNHLKVR